MPGIIKSYIGDFWIKWILISSLLINFLLILFLYFFIRPSNAPVVLHYNVFWGVDYLGETKDLFLLPTVGLFIFLLNGLLSLGLWSKNRLLAYYLAAAIFVSEVFLSLGGLALYIINS